MRGDLYVDIMVETPVNLTKKQRELLEEFKELVNSVKPKYQLTEEYQRKLKTAIKNLYIYCYKRFKSTDIISKEKKLEIYYKDVFFLTGKVDVIHVRDDQLTVMDWKTSKSEGDHSFQLSFYKHLLNLLKFINGENLPCEIIYLCAEDKNEILHISEYSIDKTFETVLRKFSR
jgi:ATP-dependent exoDNAse (exonuclease V) beta subunit